MDIHSLAIFTSLSSLIQVIALFMQFRIDKTHKGIGWWALASILFSLGFLFNFLRDIPTLRNISIAANNILFISAMYMFYWGIVLFFNKKRRHGWLLFFSSAIVLIAIIFTYFSDNLFLRRINLSIGVLVISFTIARFIYNNKKVSFHTSSNFLVIIFSMFSCLFAFRFLHALFDSPGNDLFTSTIMQELTYLGTMIASSLWTIGFILMVNQRLVSEKQISRENQKQIFDNSPDGTIISRVNDGVLLDLNFSFTNLTGFSIEDTKGKSSLDIQLWKNPKDWQFLFKEILKNGFVNNFETQLLRKDGSRIFCLVSANSIILNDNLHIVTVIRDITVRKQIEEKLRLSESMHRAILQAIPDEVTVTDMSGRVVMTSPSAQAMFLYEPHETHLGRMASDFISPEDRERAANDIRFRAQGIKTGPNEYLGLRSDGSTFDIEINGDYIFDADGQPTQILFVGRDITERKIIGEKLRQSELRYRILVETAHEGIIVRKGNDIKFANTMMQELTGYTEDELLNTPFLEMVYSIDKEIVEQNYLKRAKGEPVEPRYQFRIRTKNNNIKWIELSGNKIDWEGEPATLNMITDYTERKQIEVALNQRETSLAEAQRMAHIGNWENDLINDTMLWSAEMYRIYDVNPDTFDKKIESLLKLIHRDDLETFRYKMTTSLSDVNPVSFEYRVVHKDKSVHHLIAQINLNVDKNGKPVRQVGTVQDITERKMAEKEKIALEQMHLLNKYIEKARENERATIARDLHDDLGQALTAVKIELGLIKQKITEEGTSIKLNKVHTMLGDAIKAVQRITAQLRPEIIEDLGLQAAIEWYTGEFAQRNNISIILTLDPEISVLPDDSLVLFRIMQESLTNISRHANATKVDITMSKFNDSIQFVISDDGKGITEKELSAKKSFGLIGMRERASILGGTFEIYGEKNQGTIINLIFPQKNVNNNP